MSELLWRGSVGLLVAVALGCSKGAVSQTSKPSGASPSAGKALATSQTVPAAKAPDPAAGARPTSGPVAGLSMGPSWPRFHGPNGDNLSSETGLVKKWPEGGPKPLWTAKGLGHGFSSISLAGGLIYTTGNKDGKSTITALDLNGKILWQVDNGAAWTGDSPGTRSTPTIDGDRLYDESPLGELLCCDAKTGQKAWSVNILKQFEGENITWALSESLLIDGDRVICCPGGKKASVAALEKMSGKTVWMTKPTGAKTSYATPVLAECEGLRMILTMNSDAFLAVHAGTGELLATFPHKTSYDVNATSPIYHDGHIFITSGYGSGSALLKVKVEGQKMSVEQVWASKDLDNHHGGVILLNGCLYGAAFQRNWICLDWKTGRKMYAERGVGKGSLTYADGMLYTLSEQRDMGLVEATPQAHKVVSKFKVPSGGEGPSWAHPVVCGGRLYVRHSDQLYAYDVRAGE